MTETHHLLRALLRQRRSARGVTLLEVLIVVAIIAMVSSGVAFFALPRYKEAQIKTAETGARVIRQATQSWQASNNETNCPTMSQLVQDKQLDPGASTNDPVTARAQLHRRRRDVTSSVPKSKVPRTTSACLGLGREGAAGGEVG